MAIDFLKNFSNPVTQKEQEIIDTIISIMEKFHYTLDEVKSMSIPTYLFIVKKLNKDAEEEKKALKSR